MPGTMRSRDRSRAAMARPPVGGGGPWSPALLDGCSWWLRADLGVTLNGSSRVVEWIDQIGGNVTAPFASSAGPPVVEGLNGCPAARFGNNFDYAMRTDGFVPATGASPRSLVAVLGNTAPAGEGGYRHVLHYGSLQGLTAYGLCHVVTGGDHFGNHYWGSGLAGASGATRPGGVWVATSYDGSSDTVYVDGEVDATAELSLNTGASHVLQVGTRIVGPAEVANCDLYEAFAVSRALSPDDLAAIASYVSDRYGF